MKSLFLTASILCLSLSAASAEPIAERKAQMKARGALVGQMAPIVRGEQPFDADAVMAALEQMSANAHTDVEALYPAQTQDGDTTAAPAIWERPSEFKAAVDRYKADVDAAVAANPQDIEAFTPLFGAITSNCGACHQTFRMRRG